MSSQLLVPDIEILWESAKVAYQEVEPAVDADAIDLPVSSQTVLSGFTEQDKLAIRQSLELLTPHLTEIQNRWLTKFAEFGGKYTELIQKPIESLGLSPLVRALESEQLDQYNQVVTQAGQLLARAEVPFSLVLHAVHLYEECLMSRLMQVFPDKEQLPGVWIGLDSLFHNHLLTISLAYFDQLRQERFSPKEPQE